MLNLEPQNLKLRGEGPGSAPATGNKHDRKFQMSQNVEECLRFFIPTGICRVSPLLDPNGLGAAHIPPHVIERSAKVAT